MNQKRNNWKSQISFWGCCFIIGVILIYFLVRNIPRISIVWELADEAGYLWNAAHLLGIKWDELGKSAFYGYGYSIFLIPSFLLTETGESLITAAHITNIIFEIGIFIVFCIILKTLFERYTVWIPIIAAISSISPYLITNTYKVLCEVCFTFFYTLLVLLFLEGLKKNSLIFYTGAVLCAAFLPFIHTRGIIITFVFFIFIVADVIKRKKLTLKKIIILAAIFGIVFTLLYLIKKSNLDFRANLRAESGQMSNTVNLITPNYLFTRIKNVFQKGLLNYINSFISRFFYSICSTCGVLIIALAFFKDYIWHFFINKEENEQIYVKKYIICFTVTSFLTTLVACVFNNIGANVAYVYYGRYYEHTLPILMLVSLYLFIEKGNTISLKKYCLMALCIIISGLISKEWIYSYLNQIVNNVDTARLAVFSKAIIMNENMNDAILYLILLNILIFTILIIASKKNITQSLPVFFLSIYLLSIDFACINEINQTTETASVDIDIADYINHNIEKGENIYFINDHSYVYEETFQRMQVLLRNKELCVIDVESENNWEQEKINTGDYIIAYSTSPYQLDRNENQLKRLLESQRFILYQK